MEDLLTWETENGTDFARGQEGVVEFVDCRLIAVYLKCVRIL